MFGWGIRGRAKKQGWQPTQATSQLLHQQREFICAGCHKVHKAPPCWELFEAGPFLCSWHCRVGCENFDRPAHALSEAALRGMWRTGVSSVVLTIHGGLWPVTILHFL